MKVTQTIKLECTINAKCLNCKHMVFGDKDENFVDICELKNRAVNEDDYCEEFKLYAFWEDVEIDGTVKRIDHE